MSTVVTKNVQVGTSGTPANNFTLYQPATPDGTVRLANGNSGTTTDVLTATSAGNVGIGTSSPAAKLDVTGALNSLQARFGNVAGRGLEISTAINNGTNDCASILNAKGASFGTLIFQTDSSERARIDSSGMLLPGANATYDLGSTSLRWRNVYTNDLHLSNEGGKNSVDGTWGNWTIQEGENDLYLLNNRSGKRYKFALTEVPQE